LEILLEIRVLPLPLVVLPQQFPLVSPLLMQGSLILEM
jgi:hypothetical protein